MRIITEGGVDKLEVSAGVLQESLAKSESFDSIRCRVSAAINKNISMGIDMDCDDDGPQDAILCKYAYVMDMYPGYAVYSMESRLFSVPYSNATDGTVTLGSPSPVEEVYQPTTQGGDDESQESHRVMVSSQHQFNEASGYDTKTGKLKIRVIEAGFNKSRQRFYPANVLKRDYKVFEGAKMFADHQTESESRAKPEGSVNDWVATLDKVWAENDGTIWGEATVIDPPFKEKLATLKEAGKIQDMGVSIRAVGEATSKKIDGVQTNCVESLVKARSVDFVTFAGAGGRIEAMESESSNDVDVDLLTEAQLRDRRPDLVNLVESNARKATENMKTLEQQLQESNTKINEQAATIAQLTESLTTANKVSAQAELSKLLTESKLPEKAKDRIKAQFKEASKIEGMKEAVDAEESYLTSLGVSSEIRRPSKNNGAADNGSGDEHQESVREGKANLEESFALIPGLSEKEVKLAAKGR